MVDNDFSFYQETDNSNISTPMEMSATIVSPTIARHRFTDFEMFAEVLTGFDLDFKQISRGSFSANLQQIKFGPISISRFSTTRNLEAIGNPPPGVMTFGIPSLNCQPFIWRGLLTDGNSIQIFKPSTELSVITNLVFEGISVSIAETDFNDLNNQWGFPDLNEIIGVRERAACDPAIMYKLRKTLHYICQLADNDPDELKHSSAVQNLVRFEVPHLLLQALTSSEAVPFNSTPGKRNHALKTALEYIRSTSNELTSINSFCQQTGINERTLQRAFLDVYGVTPKAYFQALRLNSVYKTLFHSDPNSTRITDVAGKLGYWHMSQFGIDYRRQFGELPSETLTHSRHSAR
jgi:AraC family ethanolamine operon transcriptional activator